MSMSERTYADSEKGDMALQETSASVESASYSQKDSRRLVWRQDIRIVPLACLVYLLCYLDVSMSHSHGVFCSEILDIFARTSVPISGMRGSLQQTGAILWRRTCPSQPISTMQR
jgi:hypothetical protein